MRKDQCKATMHLLAKEKIIIYDSKTGNGNLTPQFVTLLKSNILQLRCVSQATAMTVQSMLHDYSYEVILAMVGIVALLVSSEFPNYKILLDQEMKANNSKMTLSSVDTAMAGIAEIERMEK